MTTPTPRTGHIPPSVALPPEITGLTLSGGVVSFSFGTTPGRTYRVDYRNDLNETAWTPLGPSQVANGNSINIADNIGASAQRFYRVVLVQ